MLPRERIPYSAIKDRLRLVLPSRRGSRCGPLLMWRNGICSKRCRGLFSVALALRPEQMSLPGTPHSMDAASKIADPDVL